MALISTTCKNSHHYFSIVSTLPTKVNVAPRPSNPRLVTLNCPVPITSATLSINSFLRNLWSCLVSSKYRRLCGRFGASAPPRFVIPHLHREALSFLRRLTLVEE
ncbi:hypothetical protein AVEN_31383-1 [Araneus ventricosus]|uniref:Uncharacterized protein n=1 Tax=Araneus ventricosus TaxID=182803 RepID=A0A4Y1ZT65_ARAVE|nr:hypothetical protein AVEN_31383-1 [Araneus ventricosus]